MAKGARASRRKENKTKLRCKIFGPQEKDRTDRLSAKLLELATRPKLASYATTMDVETETASSTKLQDMGGATKFSEEMEVDSDLPKTSTLPTLSRRPKIRKRTSHRKSSIIFPKFKSGRRSRKFNGKL